MAWPKAMPIVEVEWVDSTSNTGWKAPADYVRGEKGGLVLCRTSGYLLHRDARTVVIVQNQSESGSVNDSMTIPATCVRRLRTVRRGRARR